MKRCLTEDASRQMMEGPHMAAGAKASYPGPESVRPPEGPPAHALAIGIQLAPHQQRLWTGRL